MTDERENVRMEVINEKNQQTILMDIDINVTNPPQIRLVIAKFAFSFCGSHQIFSLSPFGKLLKSEAGATNIDSPIVIGEIKSIYIN